MNFSILGEADYVSSPIGPLRSRSGDDYPVSFRLLIGGDIGTGSVAIEFLMPDDSWQAFPELTFDVVTAQDIFAYEGAIIRVVIAGATSVNVLLAT